MIRLAAPDIPPDDTDTPEDSKTFFYGSSLVFKVLFELIPHKAVKVCMQTSKRLRANLRWGIGSLHANFCPQVLKFACKLMRGG